MDLSSLSGLDRRDLLRDVVVITAIQTTWVGAPRLQVAESLAGSLKRLLGVEVATVRLSEAHPLASARVHQWGASAPPADLDAVLDAVLDHADPAGPVIHESEREDLPRRWLLVPIGIDRTEGVIGLGSSLRTFPSPEDRILVALASNAAGVVLRNATLHQELLAARREIATMEKMSALGQLVAGVAHEVRTPLTYALNHVQLAHVRIDAAMARGGVASVVPDVKSSLDTVAEALHRINSLVGNLRRFTKSDSGTHAIADVSATVRQALDIFRATHPGGVTVTAELDALRHLALDRIRIQEVVLNLLENAADAMPQGGTITLVTSDVPTGVEIRVSDQGVGIPPEVIPRIFDPLFTTKSEGTGLGLSIVARILEVHGATIQVSSVVGEGTTFVVHLPGYPPATP